MQRASTVGTRSLIYIMNKSGPTLVGPYLEGSQTESILVPGSAIKHWCFGCGQLGKRKIIVRQTD